MQGKMGEGRRRRGNQGGRSARGELLVNRCSARAMALSGWRYEGFRPWAVTTPPDAMRMQGDFGNVACAMHEWWAALRRDGNTRRETSTVGGWIWALETVVFQIHVAVMTEGVVDMGAATMVFHGSTSGRFVARTIEGERSSLWNISAVFHTSVVFGADPDEDSVGVWREAVVCGGQDRAQEGNAARWMQAGTGGAARRARTTRWEREMEGCRRGDVANAEGQQRPGTGVCDVGRRWWWSKRGRHTRERTL
ncbi:hypothetical protein B0H14DRAFT_3557652 [Mycena olivaceomarginata]|nr:hypothetical protein B0H14DRAFT_3557652 [Mycena olivaceomarginata]